MKKRKRKKKLKPLSKKDIEKYALKVLADAIDNILTENVKNPWYREARKADLKWIISNDVSLPFSYLNVCEILEINTPSKLRSMVLKLVFLKDKKTKMKKEMIRQMFREMMIREEI